MPNERPDERPGWKQRLEDPQALPHYTFADKAASWEKLYTRLGRQQSLRRLLPWFRLAAACLLLALVPAIYYLAGGKDHRTANVTREQITPALPKNTAPAATVSTGKTSPSEPKTLPLASTPARPDKPLPHPLLSLPPEKTYAPPPHMPQATPGATLVIRRATPPPLSADRPPTLGTVINLPCPDSLSSPVLAMTKAPHAGPLRIVHINELHDPTEPGAAVTKTPGIFSFRNNSILEISLKNR